MINMQLAGLRLGSLLGILSVITMPTSDQILPAVIVAIPVIGGLLLQVLRNKQDDKRREAEKQERLDHQIELKLEIERVAILTASTSKELRQEIQENTELTKDGIAAANHVNDKFRTLAAVAGIAPILGQDTNKTVHRIEDKITTTL